jgi:hypothetical protein
LFGVDSFYAFVYYGPNFGVFFFVEGFDKQFAGNVEASFPEEFSELTAAFF